MNIIIAGFRKCVITFCIILLIHFTFSAVAVSQDLNIPPAKKNSHPRISSRLWKLEKDYKEGTGAQRMIAQGMNISTNDPDRVTVYLMPEPDNNIDEDALYGLGAQIIKQTDTVIKAMVPVDLLTTIADTVNGVSFMKTPDRLIPVAIESEGVDMTGADAYHDAGYNGSGVNVGVFDVGFIGLSNSILNDELPNSVVKVDCTVQPCNSNNPSIENTSNHGTAVAEIVHDMAPGATLYLIKVGDGLDLEDAKNFAVNNGIRIINISLVVPNTNFYDGECWSSSGVFNPVCTVDDAWSNNILWVNAVGNEALRHYEALFTDPDTDGWHNVSPSDETINIPAKKDDTIEVYLTWDAWPITDQDYDLHLYNGSNTLVASSTDSQTGSQPPIEQIVYTVPTDDTYYLSIRQENAFSNHSMEVYSIYHNLSPAVTSSSLLGPADAARAMAVGSINFNNWETGPQASYSSRGPTNDGRIKPDIMGPDNISTDVFGSGFTGTSASSAHVAGAAALILHKNPGISVDQLWNSLTSTAIYMDYMNNPNIYGAGLLNLNINAPIPSIISTATGGGGGGGGCFIATAAYGSYTEPSVRILREMRDRFLLKSSIGKNLINLYYKYSPTLADFITNHDNIKILVRLGLLPIVGISWLTLKTGPVFTLSLVTLLVFGLIGLVSNKRFQKSRKILARRTRLW
jgi:hypothetical protein